MVSLLIFEKIIIFFIKGELINYTNSVINTVLRHSQHFRTTISEYTANISGVL